ncbi:MAG: transketolase, partial [Deltaproteobacteria bacterium]|nr:transketolase [Deltaproteobacteria bacterium]
MRDIFVQQLLELAKLDRRLLLITGDLGFSVFEKFATACPKQFLNVGVAEQNMTGIATGLALEGRVVFTYSIGNFPTLRCLEQIRNDACYHEANVNVVSIGGGFSYGALGFSHHATEDLAILRALPNMTVVAPGDTWEVSEATKALVQKKGVGFLRLDRASMQRDAEVGETFTLGKARIYRDGTDATLIATGSIVEEAWKAAAVLSTQGIECRVVSMHTLKPL